MNAIQVIDALASQPSDHFTCAELPNSAVRVTTPLLYPDRTMIDVYVISEGTEFAVTDFGEALGWLWTRRGINELTPKQEELLDHIQHTSGVAFSQGRLRRDCPTIDDLTPTIHLVAQTALRIADLWFTSARRTKTQGSRQDSKKPVADWLSSVDIQFAKGVMAKGGSGRQWSIDFRVMGQKPVFLQWMNVKNRQSARARINATYAAFGDIKRSANGVSSIRRVVLFNDHLPYWQREDYRLLEEVAMPANWSDPDGLEEILRDPAPSL